MARSVDRFIEQDAVALRQVRRVVISLRVESTLASHRSSARQRRRSHMRGQTGVYKTELYWY